MRWPSSPVGFRSTRLSSSASPVRERSARLRHGRPRRDRGASAVRSRVRRTARPTAGPGRRLRREILAAADGNPLALVELPRAWRTRSEREAVRRCCRSRRASSGPSPAGWLAALPQATRDALLVAGNLGQRRNCRDPAGSNHFHPLVRSGCCSRNGSPGGRPRTRRSPRIVTDGAFRRAWHRAQSIIGPDDEIADELEEDAARSRRRGAVLSAITTWSGPPSCPPGSPGAGAACWSPPSTPSASAAPTWSTSW